MYAISAWYGFLNESHLSSYVISFSSVLSSTDVKSLITLEYDDNLFTEATSGNDAMHHLLPTSKSTCYNLPHGLSVNTVKSELHKNILSVN